MYWKEVVRGVHCCVNFCLFTSILNSSTALLKLAFLVNLPLQLEKGANPLLERMEHYLYTFFFGVNVLIWQRTVLRPIVRISACLFFR